MTITLWRKNDILGVICDELKLDQIIKEVYLKYFECISYKWTKEKRGGKSLKVKDKNMHLRFKLTQEKKEGSGMKEEFWW